jgi:hypothetical protein
MRPLVTRIRRTGVGELRAGSTAEFAPSVSLLVFGRHHSFLGALFAGRRGRVVDTLWANRAAVTGLEASPDYQATVRTIGPSGFLGPPQRVEVPDHHGS